MPSGLPVSFEPLLFLIRYSCTIVDLKSPQKLIKELESELKKIRKESSF